MSGDNTLFPGAKEGGQQARLGFWTIDLSVIIYFDYLDLFKFCLFLPFIVPLIRLFDMFDKILCFRSPGLHIEKAISQLFSY